MTLLIWILIVAVLYAAVSIAPDWKKAQKRPALIGSAALGIALATLSFFTGIESQKSGELTNKALDKNLKESQSISSAQKIEAGETQQLQLKVDSQSQK